MDAFQANLPSSQCTGNAFCQKNRNSVADLLIRGCPGWSAGEGFKKVIVREGLDSGCFPGRQGAVLFAGGVNIVMPVFADVSDDCLCKGEIL